ncbi:MAG: tRNA (adenosine(37)-N6)-dimethylallyltransferase MiaA, partial [Dokdonella sp.]
LVYRGFDIGTAKPDAETLRRYPHALVDIRDPVEAYSAADFRADALDAMQLFSDAGKIPLLVGGTGLYFRALERGLSDLPASKPEIRAAISTEAEKIGWPAMHARLSERDPIAAKRIRASDPQRIQRALEVIEMTGKPLSDKQGQRRPRPPWRFLKLALMVDGRAVLHERIAQRFDAMLDAGFLDEVRGLRQRGDLHADLPATRAVGYRQAWEFLDGAVDADTFRYRAIAATRQLAKRQITWIRSELDARCFDADDATTGDHITATVADFIGNTPATQ